MCIEMASFVQQCRIQRYLIFFNDKNREKQQMNTDEMFGISAQ